MEAVNKYLTEFGKMDNKVLDSLQNHVKNKDISLDEYVRVISLYLDRKYIEVVNESLIKIFTFDGCVKVTSDFTFTITDEKKQKQKLNLTEQDFVIQIIRWRGKEIINIFNDFYGHSFGIITHYDEDECGLYLNYYTTYDRYTKKKDIIKIRNGSGYIIVPYKEEAIIISDNVYQNLTEIIHTIISINNMTIDEKDGSKRIQIKHYGMYIKFDDITYQDESIYEIKDEVKRRLIPDFSFIYKNNEVARMMKVKNEYIFIIVNSVRDTITDQYMCNQIRYLVFGC